MTQSLMMNTISLAKKKEETFFFSNCHKIRSILSFLPYFFKVCNGSKNLFLFIEAKGQSLFGVALPFLYDYDFLKFNR